jgi:hypothetical protein
MELYPKSASGRRSQTNYESMVDEAPGEQENCECSGALSDRRLSPLRLKASRYTAKRSVRRSLVRAASCDAPAPIVFAPGHARE